ncbi:MAG: Ap4A phosphorylase II [Candidatus Sedimenticola sp. 20ELBAFRAG]
MIEPGTLWQRITETSRSAIACGALQPIETEQVIIEQNGIRFQARWVSSLKRKIQPKRENSPKPDNPFLPPEPELTVGEISHTHLGVLNKFNVIENHLLIITKAFAPQETLLDENDFDALCRCLPEFPSLSFYNGGPEAGASQRHKHLQLVPLPLNDNEPDLPIQPLLEKVTTTESIIRLPDLEFSNGFVRFADPLAPGDASRCNNWYLKLLDTLGIPGRRENGQTVQSRPYNLLLTRHWMLLIPRSREFHQEISVNALGFAGSLFVRERAQLDQLRTPGPMELLQSVAQPACQ